MRIILKIFTNVENNNEKLKDSDLKGNQIYIEKYHILQIKSKPLHTHSRFIVKFCGEFQATYCNLFCHRNVSRVQVVDFMSTIDF